MKKGLIIAAVLVAGIVVLQAQTCATGDCNCASCIAKKEGKFTLPGLQGLEKQDAGEEKHDEHAGYEHDHEVEEAEHEDLAGHDHDAHEGCDYVAKEDDHAGHDHDKKVEEPDRHAGHDHGAGGGTQEANEPDPHAGHDHGEGSGLEVSRDISEKVGLKVFEAAGGTIAISVVFPAEIKLNRDRAAAVSPRYASIVRQVFAEIGDDVRKGDVLASLENRESMAVYTVPAPFDGVIISKDISLGESAAEDRVLFEVADLSSVWADISIFPRYQHVIRKGQPVRFVAHDGHEAEGIVKYISPLVSHETRTFTARCVLEAANEDFTPGVFVRARVETKPKQVGVRVERAAVQIIEGESIVFVPGDKGYEMRVVEPGLTSADFVEIREGLNPGDKYVAAGAFALKAEILTSGMDPHAGHGH